MKRTQRQSKRRAAFTIIELLTVMSIIVILIGLLVPALNMVRRFAQGVKQHAQLHSIDAALELFNNEFDGYPDSSALDPDGEPYCGAMKLCEAMLGQDMLGFHKDSRFYRDGTVPATPLRKKLYMPNQTDSYDDNLKARKGPYLPLDNADVYELSDIYTAADISASLFTQDLDGRYPRVLCDVYTRTLPTGKKIGMPILYYKADTSKNMHDANRVADAPDVDTVNIYNHWDNYMLISMGKPWVTGGVGTSQKDHQMVLTERFYVETQSEKVKTISMPRRPDTYILISAGFDGEYGTSDDICNYQKQ